MRAILAIGLLALTGITSCWGGGVGDPLQETEETGIAGTVEITGAPLASLGDTSAIGDQDPSKWSLKLIDPVEDVDSYEIPVENNTFGATPVTTPGEYLLSISAQPAVDLSGGEAVATPVTVNIPVTIQEQAVTQVYATVEIFPPVTASEVHSVSQTTGGRLELRYTVELDELRSGGLVEIDWNARRIRRDTNGDMRFDDEEFFSDSDRDGISDRSYEQLRDRHIQPDLFIESGELEQIDRELHRIRVNGRWFRVTELTAVFRHVRRVHLGDLQVGQTLRIRAHAGDRDVLYAVEIRIFGEDMR